MKKSEKSVIIKRKIVNGGSGLKKIINLVEGKNKSMLFGEKNNKLPIKLGDSYRINVAFLNKIGSNVVLALKLLGGSEIHSVGLFDENINLAKKYEYEMNQIDFPFNEGKSVSFETISEKRIFDCDLLVFCPDFSDSEDSEGKTIRVAEKYAIEALECGFHGIFVVACESCEEICKTISKKGISCSQIQGFSLGAMDSRARKIARDNAEYGMYIKEGRVFGPCGADLVVANSIQRYDEMKSRELTRLTMKSNLKLKSIGQRSYITNSISSVAMQIIAMLKGEWHYSAVYLGTEKEGAFFGIKNRITNNGIELEDDYLDDTLFEHIQTAYNNLKFYV